MQSILLHLLPEEQAYLKYVKPLMADKARVTATWSQPLMLTQLLMVAKEKDIRFIATSSPQVLAMLIPPQKKYVNGKLTTVQPTLDDYAGSLIEVSGVEILILPPLEHLATRSGIGKFLLLRFMSKFTSPNSWIALPAFKWELFDPALAESYLDLCSAADFLACDIETLPGEMRAITCLGITFVTFGKDTVSLRTVVIPFDDEYNIAVARILMSMPVAKCFQNGKYDNAYLLRYNIPVCNWAYDTQHLFHAWYSELPKRLDFITAFMLRGFQFWKSEANTTNKMDYYGYNAKDCYTTALCWIALCREAPTFAWDNYLQEFPLVFPCLLAELTGLKRDGAFMAAEEIKFNLALDKRLKKIQLLTATPGFNPSSPPQVQKLFDALGSKDVRGTTPPQMDKVKYRHPLNKRVLTEIELYRKDRKLVTSYLRDADPKSGELKSWHGRIFFSLNPHGTDTGRLASRESAFWCGWQIQNIPRDRTDVQIKGGILADPGFYFGECDYSQAEARDTAYLSGDENLIAAVDDTTKDFHGLNAAAFFGVSYEKIVDSHIDPVTLNWIHKTVDKALRDLAKRVNHGSNYNMGEGVMLDTMGIENVLRAKKLLSLPLHWSLIQVTRHLLEVYEKTYPVVKGPYYDSIKAAIKRTGMLVGPTGWTRVCFGDPSSNKRDLNRYAAHPSQSLNAMTLNKAYMRVFQDVAIKHTEDFRLGPQIHDSILFQYRIGKKHIALAVQNAMRIPLQVTDTFGKVRTLVVPTDLKGEATRWSEVKPIHG
jgi:DNA polymerase I-like protein with 3'-5' exonuclease and polymerase domains